MAEQSKKRSVADRNITYCLRCYKPQDNLPVHLARVCMKTSTPDERAEELQKAKVSNREWIRKGRTWDYDQLCEILPDRPSRLSMMKELLQRGFFIKNQPDDSELATTTSTTVIAPSTKDWQKILKVAKADFLQIYGNLQRGSKVSSAEKTLYRYYCEAILVFRHHQCPGALEGLTDAEWVNRRQHSGRVVIGISSHVTSTKQTATFALTNREEAWFQLYFQKIRPENIRPEKVSNSFFLSSTGEAVHSVSQDMDRLHEMYKLPVLRSRDVRKAIEATAQMLSADNQEAIRQYLTHSTGGAQQDRMQQPQFVVDTAVLLDSLAGFTSDDDPDTPGTSVECGPPSKDFSAFLARFPVSLGGQPPNKKQRVNEGFAEDRVFYDRWRSTQYAKREEYLLSQFTHRKPSAVKVAGLIAKEGWRANHPRPEDIERLWRPARRVTIETDETIIKNVSQQTWAGLAIKNFGPQQGLGVVATQPFSKGDIVCDYHGKVITAAAGRAMMQDMHNEPGYLFFFKSGSRDMCIDAQTFPCDCHPVTDTIGRRINHSSKGPNLKPLHCVLKVDGEDRHVILFRALQDITVDTQLKFDYGVSRKSFRGEGLDLEWLDE
ncbi:N-lysine methyltransferase KMT5A-A [Labeo rohita]|uniref:N-lysine methyltransferase KMT5A-A n=1 Tax=Labeo rohita TaxID=84645 RepID=A0ABQ8LA38_LABRO|nr:N-lysine methyltransferase KMT5A-A [Labeo rohita]